MTMYTIQAGDTLSAISQRTGISVAELAQRNGIEDPNLIFTGDTLDISTGDSFESSAAAPAAAAQYDAAPVAPVAQEEEISAPIVMFDATGMNEEQKEEAYVDFAKKSITERYQAQTEVDAVTIREFAATERDREMEALSARLEGLTATGISATRDALYDVYKDAATELDVDNSGTLDANELANFFMTADMLDGVIGQVTSSNLSEAARI